MFKYNILSKTPKSIKLTVDRFLQNWGQKQTLNLVSFKAAEAAMTTALKT